MTVPSSVTRCCSPVNHLDVKKLRTAQGHVDEWGMEHWRPARLSPDEAEEIAAELSEEDLGRGRLETICGKWVMDEARTLSEAADELRDFADWLVALEIDGWQLVEPVDGGHAHLVNRNAGKRIRA